MGVFAQVEWTVLAPVGGIAIYESFVARLHPMRLQLEGCYLFSFYLLR